MVNTLSVALLKHNESVLSSPPGTHVPFSLELFISGKFVYGYFISMWLNILGLLCPRKICQHDLV